MDSLQVWRSAGQSESCLCVCSLLQKIGTRMDEDESRLRRMRKQNEGRKMSERKKHPEAVNTARRLRIVMSMRGMTSADIVRASRLGDGQVSNYLNGWTCMQIPALMELCRVLRCSADFLLGLSDTPTPRGLRF